MKNITTYFVALTLSLFFSTSNTIYGQNNQINWGPELEGKGIVKLIGEEGNFLYATQSGTKLLSLYINFIKIDKITQQVVQTKKMDYSGLTTIPLDFSIVDNTLQALLVTKGKNFRKIIYDLELNKLSDEILKKFDKAVSPTDIMHGATMLVPIDLISAFRSDDQSKVAVMLVKSGKKRSGVEFYVYDIKSGLTDLYNTTMEGIDTKSQKRIIDVEVLSDGRLNVLMKQYRDGTKESKKDKPNYDYYVCKINVDKSLVVLPLPTQTNFWKNAKLITLEDESMIIAGLTQIKKKDRPNGYQLIKLSRTNEVIFNKNHELTSKNKKDKLEKTFYLSNILRNHNSGVILITKDAWARSYTNVGGMPKDDEYYSNDILLDAFDAAGKKKWSECIYRKAKEKGKIKLLSGPLIYNTPAGTSLFYNTIEKNVTEYNSQKISSEKLPNKKPVVLEVKIDKDGTLAFDKLSMENKLHIATTTSFATKDKIYFVGAKNNKLKKMNIGTLTY